MKPQKNRVNSENLFKSVTNFEEQKTIVVIKEDPREAEPENKENVFENVQSEKNGSQDVLLFFKFNLKYLIKERNSKPFRICQKWRRKKRSPKSILKIFHILKYLIYKRAKQKITISNHLIC